MTDRGTPQAREVIADFLLSKRGSEAALNGRAVPLFEADAILAALSDAGYVVCSREPSEEMVNAVPFTYGCACGGSTTPSNSDHNEACRERFLSALGAHRENVRSIVRAALSSLHQEGK